LAKEITDPVSGGKENYKKVSGSILKLFSLYLHLALEHLISQYVRIIIKAENRAGTSAPADQRQSGEASA
jgi:hypothetical protein